MRFAFLPVIGAGFLLEARWQKKAQQPADSRTYVAPAEIPRVAASIAEAPQPAQPTAAQVFSIADDSDEEKKKGGRHLSKRRTSPQDPRFHKTELGRQQGQAILQMIQQGGQSSGSGHAYIQTLMDISAQREMESGSNLGIQPTIRREINGMDRIDHEDDDDSSSEYSGEGSFRGVDQGHQGVSMEWYDDHQADRFHGGKHGVLPLLPINAVSQQGGDMMTEEVYTLRGDEGLVHVGQVVTPRGAATPRGITPGGTPRRSVTPGVTPRSQTPLVTPRATHNLGGAITPRALEPKIQEWESAIRSVTPRRERPTAVHTPRRDPDSHVMQQMVPQFERGNTGWTQSDDDELARAMDVEHVDVQPQGHVPQYWESRETEGNWARMARGLQTLTPDTFPMSMLAAFNLDPCQVSPRVWADFSAAVAAKGGWENLHPQDAQYLMETLKAVVQQETAQVVAEEERVAAEEEERERVRVEKDKSQALVDDAIATQQPQRMKYGKHRTGSATRQPPAKKNQCLHWLAQCCSGSQPPKPKRVTYIVIK